MRPPQWIKNLFVLAPLIFAQSLFSAHDVLRALALGAGPVILGFIPEARAPNECTHFSIR